MSRVNVPALLRRIEKFLKTRTKPQEGWPDIPTGELQQIFEIFQDIALAKYGTDMAGSSPIGLTVYNKKTHSQPWVPYTENVPDGASESERHAITAQNVDRLISGLSSAVEKLKDEQRLLNIYADRLKKTKGNQHG